MSSALPALAPVRVRRPEPRGEARRAALLEGLEELLRSRRLSDVGVSDITQAAGVTRSAFYFYFPSKEAAVTELLRTVFDEMLAGAQAWLDGSATDPRAGLHAALSGTAARWREHRHLILGMLDARDGDPAVRALWESWIGLFVGPLVVGVEAERAAGRAPALTPAPLLVPLLLGMNERALERNVRGGADDRETEALVEALTDIWMAAIYGGAQA